MKTLPSTAKRCLPPMRDATVVRRPFREKTGRSPVCWRMKQPVPYVFFALPASKQPWPYNAACWSPAMPAIGSARPKRDASVSAATPLLSTTEGIIAAGMFSSLSMWSSQRPSRRLYSIVRDAFVASMTCARPPVSLWISHESTVPNASSPDSARCCMPLPLLSSSQRTFVPEK